MEKFIYFVKTYWVQALVVLLAFALRVWDIANPTRMVMDERYYVIESNSVLKRGYETYSNSDFSSFHNAAELKESFVKITSFLDGHTDFFSWHPPLGKLLISFGMGVFGIDNPVGWRIMSVLFGTGVVVLAMWLAMLVFRNRIVSVVAGLLISVDGLAIALSRAAMLDVFLTFFSLLGFVFLTKYVHFRNMSNSRKSFLYIALMSVAFGLASGVKWSGLYFYAGSLLIVAVYEIYRKKKTNMVSSVQMFKNIFKRTCQSLIFFIPAYLTVWIPYYVFYAVPQSGSLFGGLKNLVLEHFVILKNGQSIDAVHDFRSNAAEWVFASHPSLMFVQNNLKTGEFIGIYSMPNLVLWISSILALAVLFILLFRRRVNLRAWILVAAVAFAWVPWLLFVNRTTYQYYTVVFEPYLYIILGYVLYRLWVRKKNALGKIVTVFVVVLALGFSVLAYPGATGMVGSKQDFSHKVFNDWTNLNVQLGLYDVSQIKSKDILQ